MAEMSEMSQVDESHTSEAVKHEEQGHQWLLMCVCGLVLLALIIGVVILVTKPSSKTAGGDDDDSDSGPSPGGTGDSGPSIPGGVSFPSAPAGPPNTLPPSDTSAGGGEEKANASALVSVLTNPTEAVTTEASTTDNATTEPARTKKPFTGVTPTPRGIPRGWFICVARSFKRRVVNLTFPEDGVCDLIYYESVCKVKTFGEFSMFGYRTESSNITDEMSAGNGPHLLHTAKTYSKTRFGVSFCWATSSQGLLTSNLTLLQTWLEFFADHNIHDTAVLNFRDELLGRGGIYQMYSLDDLRMPFELLQYMKTFTPRSGVVAERYTAAAFMVKEQANVDRIIEYMKTVHTPDAIMTFAHLWDRKEMVDRHTGCQLLPPNNFFDSMQRNFHFQNSSTMADHVESLLQFKRAGIEAHYSMILTMGAVRQKMRFPDNRNPSLGNYAVYQPCVIPSNLDFMNRYFEDPKKLCEDPIYQKNAQYQDDAKTWVTYNKDRDVEEGVAFDTEYTLRWKACHTMVNFIGEQVGVVPCDIRFDDKPSLCPGWKSEPFDRVRMLKAVNKFLQTDFWDASDLYFCLRVNYTPPT